MLFTGYSEHSIDPKLRLAIPAKYRNQWDAARDGGAWFCIPWPTGHLRLYTETSFTQMASQGGMSLTPDDATAELEVRLYSSAERLEMDAAGRITIPKQHMEFTGLSNEVVIVGARNRLEVRNKSEWQTSALERFKSLPDLTNRNQLPTPPSTHPPKLGRP